MVGLQAVFRSLRRQTAHVGAGVLKGTLASHVTLETAEDDTTLVAEDGSLVTVLAIDGSREMVAGAEYECLVRDAGERIAGRFDRQGFALQVYYACDPGDGGRVVAAKRRGSRAAAAAIGLDVEDLEAAKVRHLGAAVVRDTCCWVLWTRPAALSKSARKRAVGVRDEKRSKAWRPVPDGEAQNPYSALAPLKPMHATYVAGVRESLRELKIGARVLDCQAALRAAQGELHRDRDCSTAEFALPTEGLPTPRGPEDGSDWAAVLWPRIADQLCLDAAYDTDVDGKRLPPGVVRIGRLLWGHVDMTMAPQGDPAPFDRLTSRLRKAKVPFRISYLIESGGDRGLGLRRIGARFASATNGGNKPIAKALEGLQAIAHDDTLVRLRVTLATWAPAGQPDVLLDQRAEVEQALSSWKQCQGRTDCGDATEGVMASALALHCASTGTEAVAPIRQVIRMLPWQLAASPVPRGGTLFRTGDGRLWPFGLRSEDIDASFVLVFAKPRSGKSVALQTIVHGEILANGASRLPYVAYLDIGVSGTGEISLLRSALPREMRDQAQHYRVKMEARFACNPFDTMLGARYPSADERQAMVDFLVGVWTPAGAKKPFPGAVEIAGPVIDEMFRRYDDGQIQGAHPREYTRGTEPRVDQALAGQRIAVPETATWRAVVDALFAAGCVLEAGLAHRHAAPRLVDAIRVLSEADHIRSAVGDRTVGEGSGEKLLDALVFQTRATLDSYPVLNGATQFEVGARVCVIDLQDVTRGEGDEAVRRKSLMYLLYMHALTKVWWADPDDLGHVPALYQDYHRKVGADIKTTPKVFVADELHVTEGVEAPRRRIQSIGRVGPKYGISVLLSSQLANDFDEAMNRIATARLILSGGDGDEVEALGARFDLPEAAKKVMRSELTGPKKGEGAPMLAIVDTKKGRCVQRVYNLLGPHEVWAYTTNPDDMPLRDHLYRAVGPVVARALLAEAFPNGGAVEEMERMVADRIEFEGGRRATLAEVREDIIEALLTKAGARRIAA